MPYPGRVRRQITVRLDTHGSSMSGRHQQLSICAMRDIAGLAMPGTPHPRIDERVERIGIEDYTQQGSPVVFWDLWGELGHPVRC